MTQSALFSRGIELASSLTSSAVLLRKPWDVITSRYAGIITTEGEGISWKVFREPGLDLTILAFDFTQDSSNLQEDLVHANACGEKIFRHFEFLSTKKNPLFSVNSTAISLLDKNYEQLDQLKSEINSSLRLIVTGLGLGGPIASLFTLSLLDTNNDKKKPPLCITFGSPLVGDKKLQEAVSRSSTWSSCFLHIVSYKDPLLRKLNPHTSAYMPFGTFLFCSDTNSTCFENPESVLELLIGTIHDQNQRSRPIDYENIMKNLLGQEISKDFTPRGQDTTHSNSMGASICLQLWAALGLTPDMQQQYLNIDINALVTKLEELENKFILQRRVKLDPSNKLNKMKIDMAQLEFYKMDSKNRNVGYYDSYRNMNLPSDQDAVVHQKNLTKYWEELVEEVEIKPQKDDAAFRTRWLYGGTNYRRMVEPLAIAKYYAEGGTDYVSKNRSKHFVLLEKLLEKDTAKATSNSNSTDKRNMKPNSESTNKKNVESILTFDSCFWAHVEEAIVSCKVLEDVQSSVTEKEEETGKLLGFEKYVYGLLTKYEVSSEIFLEHSSYMTWWNQYKAIKNKETSYNSALADFMSNPYYYNVQYAKGTYNFPRGILISERLPCSTV